MVRILVSACLVGEAVRYDGAAAPCLSPLMEEWCREGRLVLFCPETAAGLAVPRVPCELSGDRVLTRDGHDATAIFLEGARLALAAARRHGARIAILKERSPSCGSTTVYDGTFSGTLRAGEGVATALLRRHGIEIFSERQVERAAARLREIENAVE
jgi:uncharacterized protein YbbK (DUF523 family)